MHDKNVLGRRINSQQILRLTSIEIQPTVKPVLIDDIEAVPKIDLFGQVVSKYKLIIKILWSVVFDGGLAAHVSIYTNHEKYLQIAHTMSTEAKHILSDAYPGVSINITAKKDSEQEAFGNGTGIM